MKSVQALLPVFGLFAAVSAFGTYSNETVVYETVTTNSYVTFCPEATTITQGTKTYTATASQTLTITACPCTITKPVTKPTVTPTVTPSAAPNGTYIPPFWVTSVVTAYTTYCPAPTSVVQGNQTYTVTSATTLTIKNCPCTVTYPGSTTTTATVSYYTTYCPSPTTIVYGPTYPVTVPVPTPGTYTIPVIGVTTVPGSAPTPTAVGVSTPVATTPVGTGNIPVAPTASPKPTSPLTASGADKATAGFGGLLLAAFVAMLL